MNAMMVIKRMDGEICPDDARHIFSNAIWKTLILKFNIKTSLELSFWPALILNNSLLFYMESKYLAEVPPPGFS